MKAAEEDGGPWCRLVWKAQTHDGFRSCGGVRSGGRAQRGACAAGGVRSGGRAQRGACAAGACAAGGVRSGGVRSGGVRSGGRAQRGACAAGDVRSGGRAPPGSHGRGARGGVLEWGRLWWRCCCWGVDGGRVCWGGR
eukprot:jgi/Ulvmu1/11677/UM008_0086.1